MVKTYANRIQNLVFGIIKIYKNFSHVSMIEM